MHINSCWLEHHYEQNIAAGLGVEKKTENKYWLIPELLNSIKSFGTITMKTTLHQLD